ncbi:hypothetical protein AVEN_122979-1 [Araneus ventricosus]|uniref:Uncharacterized protein n=1 Tax=Araneus ventricosus TaxID=182803 RepID=A0A4Y2UDM1_ARAVE|nr:hypothetical protein AVEN_122979-1 [Araneus ventricosus]
MLMYNMRGNSKTQIARWMETDLSVGIVDLYKFWTAIVSRKLSARPSMPCYKCAVTQKRKNSLEDGNRFIIRMLWICGSNFGRDHSQQEDCCSSSMPCITCA